MGPFDSPSSSPNAPRPTRQQVSRACDWCRARRVKCSSGRPCRACESRGIACITKGTDEPRSLPQALREIERLRDRVRELEAELAACRLSSATTAVQPTPVSASIPSSDAPSSAANDDDDAKGADIPGSGPARANAQWEGIFVATARSEQTAYYGPSSAFYFISRIGAYIGKTFQQSFHTMQPHGMSKTMAGPTSVVGPDPDAAAASTARVPSPCLSRAQEEHFLGTFWEGLHCNVPIVDEAAFKRHYNALWEQPGACIPGDGERKDSALVDIVLALCLQSSSTFIPRGAAPSAVQPGLQHDATLAGRWHYRRCQALSAADMESPTLATVQCLIFSLLYLCGASFQNTAHMVLAQAIRHATVLGLHREPSASMPPGERELRKRIWWALYTIEAKTCTKLGRPFAMHPSQVSVTLPADDAAAASLSGSSLGVHGSGGVTHLSYARQCQTLSCAATRVYHTVWEQYGGILLAASLTSPYKHPEVLERCAHVLTAQMPALHAWAGAVPDGLTTTRQGHGRPFALSLDRAPLAIDTLAPTYLQRQRLYLEMLYHTFVANLYRPFITFHYSPGAPYTPATERHAAACVGHSIAHIRIMHQAVMETTLLAGWHEFFLLHWNATVTVLGFLLAHPVHPSTAHARDAVEKSIEVCDVYGAHFGVAASAASIARCLLVRVDQVMSAASSGIFADGPSSVGPATAGQGHTEDWGMPAAESNGDGLAWLDPADSGRLDEFMDWALTVDSFNSLEQFFAPSEGF